LSGSKPAGKEKRCCREKSRPVQEIGSIGRLDGLTSIGSATGAEIKESK
jgi:hypothetical protein